MRKKQITIHDIARELNITASTVSRALNDNPRISKGTRKRVQKLAEKLNYQPNPIASNLRKGKGNSLGVIIPRINRHFFSNVIGGIESVASEAGYNVLISQTHESYGKEVSHVNTLLNMRVDGILLSLSTGTKDFGHVELIRKRGVPLVMFDRTWEELSVSKVELDDEAGAIKAVEHLLEQGYRKIAHFQGPRHLNVYRNRYEGYVKALRKYGFEANPDFIIENTLTRDAGYNAAKKLLHQTEKPDAVFSASDLSALGAMIYCRENQVRIPEDLAIVGFANEPFTAFLTPSLTSIEQHSFSMGKHAAELILKEMENKGEGFLPQRTVLPPELITRESSLKKNKIP